MNIQQVAEVYGVWTLVKQAGRRGLPQLWMLQYNMQVVWGTLEFKLRAAFKQAIVFSSMILCAGMFFLSCSMRMFCLASQFCFEGTLLRQ